MKLKGVNSSSLKTKQKIKQEFAKLVSEKRELSKITISELTKRIDITRGSFYSHYDNIYDVAKEFQNDALKMLDVNINTYTDLSTFFDLITKHLKANDSLYSAILTCDEPLLFMSRLAKITLEKLNIFLKKYYFDKDLDFDLTIFTYGIVELYIKYFRKETPYSLDEINLNIKRLFTKTFIKKNCA